jgi:hypothetical protein
MEDRDKEEVVMDVEDEEEGHSGAMPGDDGEEERGDKDLPYFPMTKPAPAPLRYFVAAVYKSHW